ncbi:MAG: hypothetical protein GWQ05_21585 [Verrucomicrobiaceae bacterium]|nr:hypothetical protein [Verrucomicrobiaceae bacterium]
MKFPGIERDEDGTIVIEISQTMRLVVLSAAALLVVIAIWWVAIRNASEPEGEKISRIPGNIPLAEDFKDDELTLTEPERVMGVDGPQSTLNIERLGRADREELEKIFDGILSDGLPRLQSEEVQLYDSLVERSAEIAPVRSLQFYDVFDAPRQRLYSISQLYKRWIKIDAVIAVEVAGKVVEEPLLYHVLKRDLPLLAETKPEEALAAAQATRGRYFTVVDVDYIRPVMRVWGKQTFSAAERAAVNLTRDNGRQEAFQGLAMAKLDTSTNWSIAYKWASALGNSQDSLWAQMVLAELGIHKGLKVGRTLENFPNQTLKQHLLRMQEAHRLANDYPESERADQTLYLYRSVEPYEYHGRFCVVNTFPNLKDRENAAYRLRSRWRDLTEITYVSDGYLLTRGVPTNVTQAPLINRIERGEIALKKGDLKQAESDFVTYLHYNPWFPEIEEPLTRLSQANGTWLGPGASKLDEVVLPATTFPHDAFFVDTAKQFEKLFEETAGQPMKIYAFQGISGNAFREVRMYGSFGEVSAREALDSIMDSNGLAYHYKDYGLLTFYLRDEDVAPLMGRPIELLPYPVY